MGFLSGLVTGRPNTFKAKTPTNTFQAKGATLDESSFADAVKRAQQNALAVNPQQQELANALTAQAAGIGPNPALEQLRQTTAQNIQQTAGQIASARGMNPALAARLAATAGANANQNAVGQAAVMGAQQQIAARGQLADVLSGMAGQGIQLAGTAGQLQNAQNQARISNALGTEQINAGVAAGNQNAALKAQEINAGVARDNAQFQGQVIGGVTSGAGAVLAKAEGGPIPGRARVPGDDPRNDTVPILASPGEIVLPRSVAQAKDAPEKAADFVEALKKKQAGSGAEGYGKVLEFHRGLDERLKRLEAMACGGVVGGR